MMDEIIPIISGAFVKKPSQSVSASKRAIACLRAVVESGNFHESSVANMTSPQKVAEGDATAVNVHEAIFAKMQALYIDINTSWNKLKKSSKDYAGELNLLMMSIFVRSPQQFYASQIEDILKKRFLPACHSSKLDERSNALECVLMFLRGPRWRQDIVPSPKFLPHMQIDASPNHSRTEGGCKALPHKFSCVTASFAGYEAVVFQPECLMWIQDELFTGKKAKAQSSLAVYTAIADIILALAINSMSISSVRRILDLSDHKSYDLYLPALNAARIIVDPLSGFVEHATGTRLDPERMLGKMAEDFAQFVTMALGNDMQNVMKNVGPEKFGLAPLSLTFSSISEHDNLDDKRNNVCDSDFSGLKAKPKTDVLLQLQVLQEMTRCLPFLSFAQFGGLLIGADMLQHGAMELSITLAASVQRLMRRKPESRPEVVIEIVNRIAATPPASASYLTLLGLLQVVLQLWAVIEKGAETAGEGPLLERTRLSTCADQSEVVYPSWAAAVEAAIMVALVHTQQTVRAAGLKILQAIATTRDAQMATKNGGIRSSTISAAALEEKEGELDAGGGLRPCVAHILEEHENTIVQRAIHRFMLDSQEGVDDPSAAAFATKPPELRVLVSLDKLWLFALPEIAKFMLNEADSSVIDRAGSMLYELLWQNPPGDDDEVQQKMWAGQLMLLLALIPSVHRGDSVSLNGVQALLVSTWPKLKNTATRLWKGLIDTAVGAASAAAITPVTNSMHEFLLDLQSTGKNKLTYLYLWRLMRILSENPSFVRTLSENHDLLDRYVTLTTSPAMLDAPEISEQKEERMAASTVDRCLLLDRVATAVAMAGNTALHVQTASGSSVAAPSWDLGQLKQIYLWLRRTHRCKGGLY